MRSRCLAGLLIGTVVGLLFHDSAFGVIAGLASSLTLVEINAIRQHLS
jgi:hypothetical protein